MHVSRWIAGVAIVSFAVFAPLLRSEQKDQKEAQKGQDATFVTKVSEGDLVEIELGKLAARNGSNAKVKEFGNLMVKDHTKCSEDLAAIAKKHGFTMATEISKEHKDMIAKLSKITGADFDRQYMQGQIKAHEEAVELFKTQASRGENADLKAFASKGLPEIEKHLRHAREIATATK